MYLISRQGGGKSVPAEWRGEHGYKGFCPAHFALRILQYFLICHALSYMLPTPPIRWPQRRQCNCVKGECDFDVDHHHSI